MPWSRFFATSVLLLALNVFAVGAMPEQRPAAPVKPSPAATPSPARSPAAGPRALPLGKLPEDHRLGDLKNLDGYFPFRPASSKSAWNVRAERLRRQLLVALGLWPMPTRTPDNAVVHGKVDRDGYTVERVYLESFPGHFVTGSLYRPKGRWESCPGCSARTATGSMAAFTTPGRSPSAGRLSRGPNASRWEGGIRCRPVACNWPGWAVWCSTTTWWALPTASSCRTPPAIARKCAIRAAGAISAPRPKSASRT